MHREVHRLRKTPEKALTLYLRLVLGIKPATIKQNPANPEGGKETDSRVTTLLDLNVQFSTTTKSPGIQGNMRVWPIQRKAINQQKLSL